jgi:hypothetical protein
MNKWLFYKNKVYLTWESSKLDNIFQYFIPIKSVLDEIILFMHAICLFLVTCKYQSFSPEKINQ